MPAPDPVIRTPTRVDRIVDGRTVACDVLGIRTHVTLPHCVMTELIGKQERAESEAVKQLRKLAPPGSEIVVEIRFQGRPSYLGDILADGCIGEIWRDGDDESLSQYLVGMGLASESKPNE